MTKTTQELVKKDDQLLQEWQKMQSKGGRKGYNTLKLINDSKDPDFGKFFATRFELDSEAEGENWTEIREEVDLGKAEFFPVKSRVQIIPPFSDGQPKYKIQETDDSWIEIRDKDNNLIEDGMYTALKEKYNLKYSQSVYCFYNAVCYKFVIKGAVNMTSWFKTWGKIVKKPQTFKIIRMPQSDAGTTVFYPLVFELTGNEVPIEEALKMAKDVNEELARCYEGKMKAQEAEKIQIEDVPYDVPDDLPFDHK